MCSEGTPLNSITTFPLCNISNTYHSCQVVPKFVDNCLHVVSASLGIALHEITSLVFLSQILHVYTTVLPACQTAAWPKRSLSTFCPKQCLSILYGCWSSPKSPDITGHVYAQSVQKPRSRARDSLIASPSHSMTIATHTLPATHELSSRDNTDPGLLWRGCTLFGGQRGEFSHAATRPAVPLTHRARKQGLDLLHLLEQT